jgi:elongation factor Ts
MAEVTAKDVAALRQATGAGILDCRKALQENGGELEAATKWLREQGLSGASKRADRTRAEGAVSVVVNGKEGAVVALECETDFVAKSNDFVALVDNLADACATFGEAGIARFAAEIDQIKVTLKENIAVGRYEQFVAGDDSLLESYLHVQNGRGVNGVLIEVVGGSAELAHDIAVHIAFARPDYLTREQVPASAIEAERETIKTIALKEGKPEAQLDKIIEGRLNGWFKERVLLEQSYARDEKKTISQLLDGASIRRFAQVVVGA